MCFLFPKLLVAKVLKDATLLKQFNPRLRVDLLKVEGPREAIGIFPAHTPFTKGE